MATVSVETHGSLDLPEFLQMMSAIKSGTVSHSRFAKMAEMDYKFKLKSPGNQIKKCLI